jgi:hypothetical protein
MTFETGLIYANTRPHLYSCQASFPSLALLPQGELLAAFALGAGFESLDQRTVLARSCDHGRSWQYEGPLFTETTVPPSSSNVRMSCVEDGELVAMGARWNRSRADEGLTNSHNLGFVETELILLRSLDGGRSWSGPTTVAPPLVGPSFEICCPILALHDGRWLFPTSTWRGWDGDCPNGMKAIALVSYDRGATWPAYVDVMDGSAEGVIFWEQKLLDLGDGRLLAVCWTYDERAGCDREIHYAISDDYGRNFHPPCSTGLAGQTATPLWLGDSRLLCVYRRTDQPGLWAAYCRLDGGAWVTEGQVALWGHGARGSGYVVSGEQMSESFTRLRFGLPAALMLPDGEVFVAFWCFEDCVSVIRWFRLPASLPAS